jgi:hypothetical protein
MTETIITCPHCGGEFPLTEALTARLHAEFDAEYQTRLKAAVTEAEQRARADLGVRLTTLQKELDAQAEQVRKAGALEIELRQKALNLEQGQAQAIEKARLELEEKLRREAEEKTRTLIALTEKKAREDAALEKRILETRLAEERQKLEAAQQAELDLRKKADELEARARELDLELARKLDAKKTEWEAGVRQTLGVEQELKLKEKEKQIEDMKKVIDDLKRKSEQGSQELQGEVLEIDIHAVLEHRFPQDLIRPVPKGMTGADLIQEVRDAALNACGSLIWEVKNTKHWQPAWIDKLKADQRTAGAALAVLVSVALPEGMRGFAQIDGVWVRRPGALSGPCRRPA